MIHENMSMADYLAKPGINQSRLKLMADCPARAAYMMANLAPATEAMELGHALHCATLEPDQFLHRFICEPKFDRRTTAGKTAALAFADQCIGKTPLRPDDYEAITKMSQSLRAHPSAGQIILHPQRKCELVLDWTDPVTGLICKARLDLAVPSIAVADVKTTAYRANHKDFASAVLKFGYHNQAAWYLDAAEANGLDCSSFVFIVVESIPPHLSAAFVLDQEAVSLGRRENRRNLDLYAQCQANQSWPGYPSEIQPLTLPAWAYKE